MSLQTSLTSRRQFLERAAWGFGSAFVLPSLLTSCTDHLIDPTNPPTNPGKPIYPPLIIGDDSDIDWNNDIKTIVTTGLSLIPEVGGIISAVVSLAWPGNGNGPWDAVRSQVEALIDQKLADDDYNRVTANLQGLSSVIKDYQQEINNQGDIKTAWLNAFNDFELYQSNFQQAGDEALLLPLFAQFANLYLTLLRDALLPSKQNPSVVNGKAWGMNDADIATYRTKLTSKISEFRNWASVSYSDARIPLASKRRFDEQVEPFRSTNAYDRPMTSLVLDYYDSWTYYDLTKYPNGAQNPDGTKIPLFTREIYSDPYGNRLSTNQYLPDFDFPPPATQFPTQLTVWGGKYIGAVQLTYRGPNGVLTTPGWVIRIVAIRTHFTPRRTSRFVVF